MIVLAWFGIAFISLIVAAIGTALFCWIVDAGDEKGLVAAALFGPLVLITGYLFYINTIARVNTPALEFLYYK
jgi:apolipoprotein N-acyltransferase